MQANLKNVTPPAGPQVKLPEKMTYRGGLAHAMTSALADHDNTLIIGQGVTDFKEIFGTLPGLFQKYGAKRLVETPLSEEGVTGICIGAALNGLYPINTHIRADFGLLAFNQIINLAAKYKYMFGGLYEVPMLIRFVIGRSWGQGAQHSQSLQSMLSHVPGLVVVMPSTPEAIVSAYAHAVGVHKGPVISFEHRLMYDLEFTTADHPPAAHPFDSRLEREGKDVTIVATSIMVLEARRAAAHLAQHGIDCEIIDLNCISHPNHEMILKSVKKTGRLLVADTSWESHGVVAEVCRIVAEKDPTLLRHPVKGLGMTPAPCPTAKALEDIYYPTHRDVADAAAALVAGKQDHGIPLPEAKAATDFYKHFRGPF
jgi:pyruvate/2-oxoglutarate/acetoin dehydrogenase E1 component